MFNGVLFDFDGVLAKSVDDHARAWVRALADFGLEIRPEDWYPLEGMKVEEIAKTLWSIAGGDLAKCNPKKIFVKKTEHFTGEHKFLAYPGVEELILRLEAKRIPIAIVTSSIRQSLEATVPRDFLNLFDALISGDMVKRGKPFPDPYLAGAKILGLSPKECIAVENAPFGIDSAKTAGCFCIAVCSTNKEDVLKKADLVLPSFNHLLEAEVIKDLVN